MEAQLKGLMPVHPVSDRQVPNSTGANRLRSFSIEIPPTGLVIHGRARPESIRQTMTGEEPRGTDPLSSARFPIPIHSGLTLVAIERTFPVFMVARSKNKKRGRLGELRWPT